MTLKTKQINTGKATILTVELPKGVSNLRIDKFPRAGNWLTDCDSKELNAWKVNLPQGNWKSPGFADQITEEQAMEVVEHNIFDSDYKCATDKLNSLLKANAVVTVNPYGSEPPHNYGLLHLYPTGDELMDLSFQDALRWQTAQSQLWENVYILVKVD
jgi:hypothetical protein